MKVLHTLCLLLAAVPVAWGSSGGRGGEFNNDPLPEAAMKQLYNAITLADEGLGEATLQDFEELAEQYPDSYLVLYEYSLALYRTGRYKEAVSLLERLTKSRFAEPQAFAMYGNALDMDGKSKKALKAYDEGLKRFPDSGYLYLERGIVKGKKGNLNEALSDYEKGIAVEPAFASNYFRAAQLYFDSTVPAWGLVYGETEILLAPSKEDRHEEMAYDIMQVYADDIRFDKGDVTVKICPSHDTRVNSNTGEVFLGFPGIYESCLKQGAISLLLDSVPYTASIEQVARLRRVAAEVYFSKGEGLYGDSMYLLEFQKKVMEAGHWEAYNYFLLGPARPQEYEAWMESGEDGDTGYDRIKRFVDWFNTTHPFMPDAEHTVGRGSIWRCQKKLDMMKALLLMGALESIGEPSEDAE